MLRLLALTFLLPLISCFALAAAGELKTTFSSMNSQGALASAITNAAQGSTSSTEFALTSPTLASLATIHATVTNSVLDDPSFSIRGLRQSNVQFGIDLNKGPHQLQISHSQVVSESPIAAKNYLLAYTRSFYSQTSFVGLSLTESDRLQPLQTFIDPVTAATKARPITLSAKRQELFYEQILSENLRGHYSLLFGQREDRPDHAGAEVRHSYAINSKWTTRFDLGTITEYQSQALKDEKGYLSTTWGEALLNYQPNLDWMIQLGYGASFEKEYQPSTLITNALTQVGTDSYLLKILLQQSGWQAAVTAKNGISNTGFKSDSLTAEFAWEI